MRTVTISDYKLAKETLASIEVADRPDLFRVFQIDPENDGGNVSCYFDIFIGNLFACMLEGKRKTASSNFFSDSCIPVFSYICKQYHSLLYIGFKKTRQC